jgi:dTDP-4-dehydrorhamnose 3,5-epimerase-like enzyme
MIELNTIKDERGSLTAIDDDIPFNIKRVFYIYNTTGMKRGGHRHKKTHLAFVCLSGSCEVTVNNGSEINTFFLERPDKCLLLEPKDWHTMQKFSEGAVLLVLASEPYDKDDHIYEEMA